MIGQISDSLYLPLDLDAPRYNIVIESNIKEFSMYSTKILWVEDDYLEPFEAALKAAGYNLDRAFFLSDAIEFLEKDHYDLILLDVMIPLEAEDMKMGFTNCNTEGGNKSGLEFYRRYREHFRKENTHVLVYSILGDPELRSSFTKADLPERNFLNKISASNVNDLLFAIEDLLTSDR